MTTPATFGSDIEAIDAALARANEAVEHYSGISDRELFPGWIIADVLSNIVAMMRDNLQRVTPPPATAQRWISTKERLPELWTDVMVIVASHSDQIYPRHLLRNDTGTWEDEWGHLFEGMDPESTVLAWRELPTPPEHKP